MAQPEVTHKIALFRRCFSGLDHVYGTYHTATGRVRQVKAPVTDRVIYDHLAGRQPYGVYLLVKDRTRAIAADFDDDDLEPVLAFVANAKRYGIESHVERSKSKGYHNWIFLDEQGVSAAKARLVVRHILTEIGRPHTEVFPKHDVLDTSVTSGNFIFAPMFQKSLERGRTVFVDPTNPLIPIADQWTVLANVRRVSEAQLDAIIEINELVRSPEPSRPSMPLPLHQQHRSFGLPPCTQRMLAEGVTAFQRVACFRLAVALKNAGVPADLAQSALEAWSRKNRPPSGKAIVTTAEIDAQVRGAYGKDYRSYGCDDPAVVPFCDQSCPIYARRHGPENPEIAST